MARAVTHRAGNSAQQRTENVRAKLDKSKGYNRGAEVTGVDRTARTVDLAFSSEAEVSRWFGIEVLSHDAEAVDLSRLNDGGAVLDNHDLAQHLGVVVHAWVDPDRKCRAVVRFGSSASADAMLQGIADGIKRHVSVGYRILEVKLTEEREGVDVYTVTRWEPYEISIVPVPADTTVGIGRSADIAVVGSEFSALDTHRNSRRNNSNMPHDASRNAHTELGRILRDVADEASMARGFKPLHTPGFSEPRHEIKVSATRSILVSLKATSIAGMFGAAGQLRQVPAAKLAGETLDLEPAIIMHSRVAWAGAHALVMPDSRTAHAVGNTGSVALQSVPSEFRRVNAALFQPVELEGDADGELEPGAPPSSDGDAHLIGLPVIGAKIDWKLATALGVRFELKRSQLKAVGPEQLYAEIGAALAMGLARAADSVLLSALNPAALPAFTFGAPAALGLRFDDLRALVGTAGIGAVVAPDGGLSAAGIAGELTAGMTGTVIGHWESIGIAIEDGVAVHFERLGIDGSLAVTAWATLLPLIPDATRFWKVAA